LPVISRKAFAARADDRCTPQAGWYPAGTLIADAVLLVVATWLLTLGANDVIRDSNRLRAALAAGKRRLQR